MGLTKQITILMKMTTTALEGWALQLLQLFEQLRWMSVSLATRLISAVLLCRKDSSPLLRPRLLVLVPKYLPHRSHQQVHLLHSRVLLLPPGDPKHRRMRMFPALVELLCVQHPHRLLRQAKRPICAASRCRKLQHRSQFPERPQ